MLTNHVNPLSATMSEHEIKERLQRTQRLVAELSENLRKAEALRDSLIRQLCDAEGAHDRRVVGVR